MKRDFAALANRKFDLLICGGGIYGAWTAYDAARRGLRVAIVEQGDWASATSSASSKLIHGGLRYLESYDFKLVKKALAEREMLLRVAPHRVWPLNFGVPVYADNRVPSWQLKIGLTLYDFFAGKWFSEDSHHHFNKDAFAEHFPSLNTDNLKGGFIYADAQTDDARLVLELISGAIEHGAVCVNYCRLTELIERNGKVSGALVQDQSNSTIVQISAKQVVNTTGQWTTTSEQGRSWCRLTKGVHLVLPATLCKEALLLTTKSDGRVFFIIPWYGMTLLGTTDTAYSGDLNHVTVGPEDIRYLLTEANHYLKTAWTEADVVGSYAGVRTMKRSDESSPSAMSRDWELVTAENGVHHSIGGKITSAREDAAIIVNKVCAELGVEKLCATKDVPFPWTPTATHQASYAEWSASINAQAQQLGVDAESSKWLTRRHGKRVVEVLNSIEKDVKLAERITPTLPFIYADLLFCARNEMVMHLDDLLRRRLPLLILAKLTEIELRHIAETVAAVMGWGEVIIKSEIERCLSYP
jgi:glycerol-3-phosphate dehydrogenase